MNENELHEKIVEFLLANGGNRWKAYGYDRIYFNPTIIRDKIYREGFEIPSNVKSEIKNNKTYYDMKSHKFYGISSMTAAFKESFENHNFDINEDFILEEYVDD